MPRPPLATAAKTASKSAIAIVHSPVKSTYKPFPGSTRIGADIVHIPRVLKIVEAGETRLQSWITRNFNHAELNLLWRYLAPFDRATVEARKLALARTLAGRWALKEATIKAHPTRILFPSDIAVLPPSTKGRPQIQIAPKHRIVLFDNADIAAKRGVLLEGQAGDGTAESQPAESQPAESQPAETQPAETQKADTLQHTPSKKILTARLWRPPNISFEPADGSVSHDGDYAFATVQVSTADETPDLLGRAPRPGPMMLSGYLGATPAKLLDLLARTRIPRFADDGDGKHRHVPMLGDYGEPRILRPGGALADFLEGRKFVDDKVVARVGEDEDDEVRIRVRRLRGERGRGKGESESESESQMQDVRR